MICKVLPLLNIFKMRISENKNCRVAYLFDFKPTVWKMLTKKKKKKIKKIVN